MRAQNGSEEFLHAIRDVTPDLAEKWLAQQFEGQRGMRDHHVLMLAQEMESGSFIPHSSIVFACCNGNRYLIDGQHRLKAITLFGQPVAMPVLERHAASMQQVREWYASIDQGLKRTARDAIRAQGLSEQLGLTERQAGRLSGAVKLIASGFMDITSGISARGKVESAKTRSNSVVSRLMRAWSKEASVYFDLVHGGEPSNMYLFDRAPIIACALLTIKYHAEKASEFWSGIARDDGLSREDPRKRFLVWLRDGKHRQGDVARGFAITWGAFLDERPMRLIRFEKGKPIDFRGIPLQQEINNALQLAKAEGDDLLGLLAEANVAAE